MLTDFQCIALAIAAILLVAILCAVLKHSLQSRMADHKAHVHSEQSRLDPVVIFFREDLWEKDFITNKLLPEGTIRIISDDPLRLNWLSNRRCAVVTHSPYIGGPSKELIKKVVGKLKPKVLIIISDENAGCPEFDELAKSVPYYGRQYCHVRKNPLYRRLDNAQYIPLGYNQGTGLEGPLQIARMAGRKNAWGFVGSPDHGNRKPMLDMFYDIMGPGDVRWRVPPIQVSECYLNCVFVPQGRGSVTPTCFRHFEASMAGAIPVLCLDGYGVKHHEEEIQDLLKSMDNPPWLVFDTWEDAARRCKALLSDHAALQMIQDNILEWWGAMMSVRKARIAHALQEDTTIDTSCCDNVTTIINTSCRQNVPKIDQIQATLLSVKRHLPSASHNIIIVFDGADINTSHNIHQKCQSICNQDRYKNYVDNVKQFVQLEFPSSNTRFIVLPYRRCLTDALQIGIDACDTEYINIMQEDLEIIKPVDLQKIINTIKEDPEVDIVRYSKNTNDYHEQAAAHFCTKSRHAFAHLKKLKVKNGLQLSRANMYSDQNHISTKTFYKDTIFPNTNSGDFMEHNLMCEVGQKLPRTSWYLDDYDSGDYVQHLDGRHAN